MKPNPKKLEREVAEFNARFSLGAEVDYYEVLDLSEPVRLRTRSAAEVLSGHTAVVWLEGKRGCVCCSHCKAPAGAAAA